MTLELRFRFFGSVGKTDLLEGALHVFFVEHVFFTVISDVDKDALYESGGFRVTRRFAAVTLPVSEWHGIVVVFLGISFRCRELIANAFDDVLVRHHGDDLALVVVPIFYMVLVSSSVVEPRAAYTLLATGDSYGRAMTLVEFNAFEKFGR